MKRNENASVFSRMNNRTVKRLWNSFCFCNGEIDLNTTDEIIFRIGETETPMLPRGSEFALKVDEKGICIIGENYGGLMRGFFALLMKAEYEDGRVKIRHTEETGRYIIKNRMIHICIFPENDLYFIKKLIRLSALCQYTHIVMEFWGMLKYDCLRELSWPHAFTKGEVKELITECRELGIEPIPMYNQLGHASGSRLCYGKHVVLDQNPALQYLFTPDGWAWNIQSAKTAELLKQVRKELYELFGKCEYMHIGCDEAYYITRNSELRSHLPEYLKNLTYEVENEGRRPMMWMDMLLEEGMFENCCATGIKEEAAALRGATARSTVFVDWQYSCYNSPIPSLDSLKNCGHDCIGAPWFEEKNYTAHINTVSQNGMFGIMLTTWHTLKDRMESIYDCAQKCGAKDFVWGKSSHSFEKTATLLRRVSFEGNSYENCGWSKKQIGV
ncbi:MAG: family 20 glycosylhydrolase [Firmicutes bacterium]|nr:family 20 glycosylhydrolase [Bacillota bacterium]